MATIQRILLASSSPFRKKLLASTGLEFLTQAAEIDEYALVGANPGDTCLKRARAKALAVAALEPDALVIGCDQVLEFDGKTFDKARSAEEAAQRLREFAGKTHFLVNQTILANHNHGSTHNGNTVIAAFEKRVAMNMRPLNEDEIAAYVRTGEWHGCVGCYQFENRGSNLFEQTSEEHSAIVGLPLQPLLQHLRRMGINPLLAPRGPWQIEV